MNSNQLTFTGGLTMCDTHISFNPHNRAVIKMLLLSSFLQTGI